MRRVLIAAALIMTPLTNAVETTSKEFIGCTDRDELAALLRTHVEREISLKDALYATVLPRTCERGYYRITDDPSTEDITIGARAFRVVKATVDRMRHGHSEITIPGQRRYIIVE